MTSGSARLCWDGRELSTAAGAGREFQVDPRCLTGEPVRGAWAHVCALGESSARVRFDEPEIQQVRRDALAWWVPLLGASLVCLTTLALDASHYGGAVTVARSPNLFELDPFARIFPGTVVRSDLFCEVAPPAGPVIERYSGVAWPGGSFS
ncbi:MAG: hypothetical protein H0V94_03280 [Actinobacteria bacterium]|nr:hypothetical protein [Actinomycetota bacterium]